MIDFFLHYLKTIFGYDKQHKVKKLADKYMLDLNIRIKSANTLRELVNTRSLAKRLKLWLETEDLYKEYEIQYKDLIDLWQVRFTSWKKRGY